MTTLQSLTNLKFYVLYIAPVDTNPFISYLAMLCPSILNMEVRILRELSEDSEGAMNFESGDGPAFVKRFFDYKDQMRELKVSNGDSVREIY
ncbi:hypothetical protein FRB94_004775 [Tulasnella sp. JGI-2019a]|nr:hypothetical protein FRB94_004775 [Tulasnella sp. JGI-2019a]KAG9015376.1 hypothetical protein FRB93_013076 [Tulasnella sp. JGI-2019a]